ncbi:MAG: LysR substrate-binding domain-containing protein [Faecousia sp.]
MNTTVMEYIIAIAEERSVTKAAERFFLSTAALHRHIRNVENDLGTPIFCHGKCGMQLTPAGVIFVNNAQAILHLEQEMKKKLENLCQENQNVVRVAVDNAFYNSTVRHVLPAFQKEFPECRLELFKCNITQIRKLLLAEEVDLGVTSSVTPHVSGLESIPIMTNRVQAVFPPGYQGPTDMEHLAEVQNYGLIPMLHPIGSTIRMMEEQRLIELRVNPPQILEGHYRDAIHDILNGTGYGFLPSDISDIYRPRGVVVGETFLQFYDMLVYSATHPLPAECKTLMNMMIECYAKGGLLEPYRAETTSNG